MVPEARRVAFTSLTREPRRARTFLHSFPDALLARRVASPGSVTAGEEEEEGNDHSWRSSATGSDGDYSPYSRSHKVEEEAGHIGEVEMHTKLNAPDEHEEKRPSWVRVSTAPTPSNSPSSAAVCCTPPIR